MGDVMYKRLISKKYHAMVALRSKLTICLCEPPGTNRKEKLLHSFNFVYLMAHIRRTTYSNITVQSTVPTKYTYSDQM
jgi:hypothetical protein